MQSERFQCLLFSGLFFLCGGQVVAYSPTSLDHDGLPSVKVVDPPSMEKPPVADGIVERYLLNPRGDVNGLLLRDGSQMYVTLRASEDLTKTIQPGDRVRAHGRREASSPLVRADVIINVSDGKSFTVPYRLDLPMPPREERPTVNEMNAAGTIEVLLYDPSKGVVNGALLRLQRVSDG